MCRDGVCRLDGNLLMVFATISVATSKIHTTYCITYCIFDFPLVWELGIYASDIEL